MLPALYLLWFSCVHQALFKGGTGVWAEEAQCVPNANVVTDTARADRKALITDVLCDYDRLIIPPKTQVEVFVYVYRLNLDLDRGLLQMLVDMSWDWSDPRLVWDPSRYSNIEELTLTSKEIWVPDLDTINIFSLQRDWDEEASPLRCSITAVGNVTCNPVFVMRTNCGTSVRHWPFDEHECVFELMSREYELVMAYNDSEISMHEKISQEWQVVSSKMSRHELSVSGAGLQPMARLEFVLRLARRNDIHVATVVVPAVVLACLVLAQLWLDPRSPGRIVLGCATVASLCLFLVYLSDTVPDDTDGGAPLVIVFFRDALVLAALVLVLGVVGVGLHEREDAPPAWLRAPAAWLLRRVPRPVSAAMLLHEDDDDDREPLDLGGADQEADQGADQADPPTPAEVEADEEESSLSWKQLSRLLDRLCFAVLSVTFAVMMIGTLP